MNICGQKIGPAGAIAWYVLHFL